jgi:hypothetical protein
MTNVEALANDGFEPVYDVKGIELRETLWPRKLTSSS